MRELTFEMWGKDFQSEEDVRRFFEQNLPGMLDPKVGVKREEIEAVFEKFGIYAEFKEIVDHPTVQ